MAVCQNLFSSIWVSFIPRHFRNNCWQSVSYGFEKLPALVTPGEVMFDKMCFQTFIITSRSLVCRHRSQTTSLPMIRKSWYRSRHRLSTKRLMFYNTAKIRGGTGFPNPTSYNCGGGGGDLRVRPRRNNTSRSYELNYAIFSSTDRCSPSFPVTFTRYQPVILEVQKQTKHPIWNFTGPGALSESYISKHFPLSEDFIIISLLKLT